MPTTTPLDVALAFTRAWTAHDLTAAAAHVADDVVFDGPLGHTTDKAGYLKGLAGLAEAVTGVTILAAYGDDQRALVMYELATKPWGTLRCAKLLEIDGGKIRRDTLAFDSFPIRGKA